MNRRDCLAALAGALAAGPLRAQGFVRKPWPPRTPTPALQLASVDGTPWTPAAERGHPVLLNFWASWCEPCRSEMPSLERLAAMHRDAGLKVLAVNFKEGEAAIRRFLAANPLALPVLRDGDGAAARAFGINIFPSTVGLDRNGRTLFVSVGEVDWSGPPGQELVRPLL
ncbi:TlpA family protein disulfide reductase [Caenimonas aquaedulcis]|uniref:TlpA family protein disulfide reductase n=1 Tax=Caenimonas aquaedulcis TaxID=2793270 RepID=A0A931H364_9BURK|nr:TlpA disulfide reductase family protein [Caenimonas aquaedulcis]MBG9387703.1 TlpA family protein disulfide reductase [Caenimonas aquaedulcis]